MSNLSKFHENDKDIFYTLNGENQGFVSIPKDLNNNIKVFMIFKSSNLQGNERNKLMSDMNNITRMINTGNDDGICIISLIENSFLENENVVSYGKELIRIKKLVNTIYNELLGNGNLKRENFIKKLELLSLDNRYNDFINWLCMQNPSKFHFVSYQELVNNYNQNVHGNVFINKNVTTIFNDPNMASVQANVIPTQESLSIGTPRLPDNFNDTSSGGGPAKNNDQYTMNNVKVKKLVKNPPTSHGFIKWYTTLFILLASLAIGITISVVLVK